MFSKLSDTAFKEMRDN